MEFAKQTHGIMANTIFLSREKRKESKKQAIEKDRDTLKVLVKIRFKLSRPAVCP